MCNCVLLLFFTEAGLHPRRRTSVCFRCSSGRGIFSLPKELYEIGNVTVGSNYDLLEQFRSNRVSVDRSVRKQEMNFTGGELLKTILFFMNLVFFSYSCST